MTATFDEIVAKYGMSDILNHVDDDNANLAAVVALPSAVDPIRLVGDEEKHATLLFLGDISTLPNDAKTTLQDTLQIASQMFSPFHEHIVDINRLGADNPPALVAMLTAGNVGPIRNALMVNPSIDQYMANTQQFPTYQPHVTLGYPDFPGEADIRKLMQPIYKIKFDRLALWWGNERVEYDLNYNAGLDMDDSPDKSVGWSENIAKAKELFHHGVKGMRWGVRKDRGGDGSPTAVTVTTKGKRIKTSGGTGHKPVDEAFEVAKTKQQAKASGTHTLSNMQLKQAVTRMQLEKQFHDLNNQTKQKNAGAKFVNQLLGNVAKQQANRVVNDYATQQVNEALKNK